MKIFVVKKDCLGHMNVAKKYWDSDVVLVVEEDGSIRLHKARCGDDAKELAGKTFVDEEKALVLTDEERRSIVGALKSRDYLNLDRQAWHDELIRKVLATGSDSNVELGNAIHESLERRLSQEISDDDKFPIGPRTMMSAEKALKHAVDFLKRTDYRLGSYHDSAIMRLERMLKLAKTENLSKPKKGYIKSYHLSDDLIDAMMSGNGQKQKELMDEQDRQKECDTCTDDLGRCACDEETPLVDEALWL